MSLKFRWILVSLLLALPYLVLGAAGAWWLFDNDWWLLWIVGTTLVSVMGWHFLSSLRTEQRRRSAGKAEVIPPAEWSPVAQSAWKDVETLIARTDAGAIAIDRPEPLWMTMREVLETVARRFHPKSKAPLLEIQVPYVLRVAELVAHDMRLALSERIPGSHVLTIHDLMRLKRVAEYVPSLYRLYRLVGLIVSPATSLAREMNLYLQGQALDVSAQETKVWAVRYAMKRAGYYAIELYSGRLVLDDVKFTPFTSKRSQHALTREAERDEALSAEPFRVLIIGQVKSGKSSLVNALFGETRAAVDVVPRTKNVEPYLLEREGIRQAIILDTAGYEDVTRATDALDEARDELLKSDLVLLVCSALSAARDADRRFLDEVRALFQSDPDREFPPLIIVLTHIDQLRPFREWNPPYDLRNVDSSKASQIREAVEAAATDLSVPVDRVVPVCLAAGSLYNVNEALIPSIVSSLDAAQRLKYVRCLRELKDEETWRRLREQAVGAGRLLFQAGRALWEKHQGK